MIESIQIKNLRGIREGSLEGLTPLTVLVGPNSSGKSTVLDALLIAASPSPGEAVGQSVYRRTERDADSPWLLWRQGDDGPASLRIKSVEGERSCTLSVIDSSEAELRATILARSNRPRPFSGIHMDCRRGDTAANVWILFAADNTYAVEYGSNSLPSDLRIEQSVRLIDMRGVDGGPPLPSLYTEAVTQGRRDEVRRLLNELVPGLESLEILVNRHSEPVLHLLFSDKSVPVALTGDGIRSMLRLCLELAGRGKGVILIEEPEVHQHPRALQQSAKALLASMRRGNQIILSTHSLELIDALLLEATQEDLSYVSTYRLNLNDGALVSSRIGGEKMVFARGEIEEDLR